MAINTNMGFEKSYSRVSEESPEYRSEIERRASSPKGFGETCIKEIDRARERLDAANESGAVPSAEDIRISIVRELDAQRVELRRMAEIPQLTYGLKKFFEEARENESVRTVLDTRISLEDIPDEKIWTVYARTCFADKDKAIFTDEIIEKMLRYHAERFVEKRGRFEASVEKTKNMFSERVFNAIGEGWLPVREDCVRQRVADFRAELFDIVGNSSTNNGEHKGEGRIQINSEREESDWEGTIFHEMTHAVVAGKTLLNKRLEKGEKIYNIVEEQRSGLFFRGASLDQDRYRWINEAVTEEINIRLLGKDRGVYERERQALQQRIYDKGIERDVVYQAYCENYETEPYADVVTGFKKFIQRLNEVYADKKDKGIGIMRAWDNLDKTLQKAGRR